MRPSLRMSAIVLIGELLRISPIRSREQVQ